MLKFRPLCIACSVSDLGDPAAVDGDPSVCAEGETPLFISGGTVCYTGTTPGSTAVYHCGEGHELVDGQKTRECQTSGEWSGIAPSCALIKSKSLSFMQLIIYSVRKIRSLTIFLFLCF